MDLDWAAVETVNTSAVQEADEVLKDMIKAIVDSLGVKISDEARTRLALHMATTYKGASEGTGTRTFCALPCIDDDEQLAKSVDGAEYLLLRGVEDPLKPVVVVASEP